MGNLETLVTWVDARDRLPRSGVPVAAAITGRYPADGGSQADGAGGADGAGRDVEGGSAGGEEFWLVRPMYFAALHFGADGTEYRDCFVDSDGVVRLPYGLGSAETVTHWAELPTLPGGMTTRGVFGEGVQAALQRAWGDRPRT
ncbi:AQJ64_40280 family protein [Streptomyces sp. NPDC101175]|uniref:AQJ64_40280 family protein n=1 Tax=Streptomyces sp. NPDC101175 TaxID=3366123 RepID=UPI003834CEC0